MAVYVDDLMDWGWKLGPSCHLIADSNEELHAFAAQMGLKREWFQRHNLPHYDLTKKRRGDAIRLGAQRLGYRQMAHHIIRWKRQAALRLKDCTTPAERQAVWDDLYR